MSSSTPAKAMQDGNSVIRLNDSNVNTTKSASSSSQYSSSRVTSTGDTGGEIAFTAASDLSGVAIGSQSSSTAGQPCTEFHLFNKLPIEVRIKIWTLNDTPRLVSLLSGKEAPIALLQVCHESRDEIGKKYQTLGCKEVTSEDLKLTIYRMHKLDMSVDDASEQGPLTSSLRINSKEDIINFRRDPSEDSPTLSLAGLMVKVVDAAISLPNGWGTCTRIALGVSFGHWLDYADRKSWRTIFDIILVRAPKVKEIFVVWREPVKPGKKYALTFLFLREKIEAKLAKAFEAIEDSREQDDRVPPQLQFIKADSAEQAGLFSTLL